MEPNPLKKKTQIKLLDPKYNTITTLAGTGTAGFADGRPTQASFSEPAGLAFNPTTNTLYVADTNNNLIRTVQLDTGMVGTVSLKNCPPPRVAPGSAGRDPLLLALAPPEGIPLVAAEPLGGSGEVQVRLDLPRGYHYTPGAGIWGDDVHRWSSSSSSQHTSTSSQGHAWRQQWWAPAKIA